MGVFRHTLLCDGPTDANLIPILDWVLRETGEIALPQGELADLFRLGRPPTDLEDKIKHAVELYPCELLFIHRDAEREPPTVRREQIRLALEKAAANGTRLPAIAVVPVRMLEAWLLFDEPAIRRAAGNPRGNQRLDLPPLADIENRPDPKEDLKKAPRVASGLHGRRLKKFDTARAFWRILDHIHDFAPLRTLPAFRLLERDVERLRNNAWAPSLPDV